MGYSVYSFTIDDLTGEVNSALGHFINSMLREGVITEEQHGELQNYQIVIAKKGYFGRLWDKLFNKENNGSYFVVKVITPNVSKEENKE